MRYFVLAGIGISSLLSFIPLLYKRLIFIILLQKFWNFLFFCNFRSNLITFSVILYDLCVIFVVLLTIFVLYNIFSFLSICVDKKRTTFLPSCDVVHYIPKIYLFHSLVLYYVCWELSNLLCSTCFRFRPLSTKMIFYPHFLLTLQLL